jgi:hypothetical protein
VIAVDTNILVYAHRSESGWNERAADCVRGLAEGARPWMIPWPCIHEFLAIVTHPRIFRPPTQPEAALRQVALWRDSPTLVVAGESPLHWETLRQLCDTAKVLGPLIHDARIAAICVDHGVDVLWSADRDYSRFPALRTVNPMLAPS